MTDTLSRVGPTALTTSAATLYTVPSSTKATLRYIHVCNETATARTFTMSIGTDGAGKRLFTEVTVAANDSFSCDMNLTLEASEILQGLASANTALTVHVGMVLTT